MAACEEAPSASVRKQRFAKRENLVALMGEIIGERVFVKDASCRGLLALKGVVVDESLSTLTVRTSDGKNKRIPKKGVTFVFPDLHCEARGDDFVCRPEDRTKRIAQKIAKMPK
ncbi:MAG: ribonuclease P protein subunit [Candidatus Norongarragalinales archaeon]